MNKKVKKSLQSMQAGMPRPAPMSPMPPFRVFRVGQVASVLDSAREPGYAGALVPFASLLAESQTAGRGQRRRCWASPAGNVYGALRLPMEAPFLGTEAAVAASCGVCLGLASLGYEPRLKWPNDVAVLAQGRFGKVCGTLLEERGDVLLAGIGVNVASCPERGVLRERTALPACSLAQALPGRPLPELGAVWEAIVNGIYAVYTDKADECGGWLALANRLLLWRGRAVELEDGPSSVAGRLSGIGPAGEIVVEQDGRQIRRLSGSLAPARGSQEEGTDSGEG